MCFYSFKKTWSFFFSLYFSVCYCFGSTCCARIGCVASSQIYCFRCFIESCHCPSCFGHARCSRCHILAVSNDSCCCCCCRSSQTFAGCLQLLSVALESRLWCPLWRTRVSRSVIEQKHFSHRRISNQVPKMGLSTAGMSFEGISMLLELFVRLSSSARINFNRQK